MFCSRLSSLHVTFLCDVFEQITLELLLMKNYVSKVILGSRSNGGNPELLWTKRLFGYQFHYCMDFWLNLLNTLVTFVDWLSPEQLDGTRKRAKLMAAVNPCGWDNDHYGCV